MWSSTVYTTPRGERAVSLHVEGRVRRVARSRRVLPSLSEGAR